MGHALMHNGVKWTGEGFPPDSPQRLAVLGVDAESVECTCATLEWTTTDPATGLEVPKEGHHPDCPLAPTLGVKSVVGGVGDSMACTCEKDWRGEGHQKGCAKRVATAGVCTCRQLKWTEEGHSPECATRKPVEVVVEDEAPKRRRKE